MLHLQQQQQQQQQQIKAGQADETAELEPVKKVHTDLTQAKYQ
jgi:hypothetical protein